jgi:hypothetical protein
MSATLRPGGQCRQHDISGNSSQLGRTQLDPARHVAVKWI